MNDTTQLNESILPPGTRFEFNRLPIGALQPPAGLFDPRDVHSSDTALVPNPLTVYPSGEGSYLIIDGCKRFTLEQTKKTRELDCMVLTPPPTPDQAALLRMTCNRSRPLRFFEKVQFVAWLQQHGDEKLLRATCATLALDNRERTELTRLIECDPAIIDAVFNGKLDRALAPELQRLEEPDRKATLAFFAVYSFSRQMQRELLDWLPELAFRERKSIVELLTTEEVLTIGASTKLNGPQKIEHLRELLYNRRFPTIARAKQTWKELAARSNPDPRQVQFKPSEAFEKNRLELKITITDAKQAHDVFSQLSALAPDVWNQLIYPAQFYR